MMKRWIAGTALAGLAAMTAPAIAAEPMTVADFLAKTNTLRSKGLLAIGSPDIQLLKDEVTSATVAYRADLAAQRAAGQPPHSCPPPRGQVPLTSTDLIAEFNAIPPAERTVGVKAAFYAMMKKRYPCKAA
jgi:hypothetical protein